MTRSLSLVIVLALLVVAGCAPHVEWLPDSESFVFTHQDGRVLHYDVGAKRAKELGRFNVAEDGWPVFSRRASDGLLVIAETTSLGNKTRLVETKLHLRKLDGTRVRTQTLTWLGLQEVSKAAAGVGTYVEWSPKGTHVLVATKDAVAIYEDAGRQFKIVENVAPALPVYFGASPWRPDGAGFLATRPEDDESTAILFVTLDGKVITVDSGKSDELESDNESWPIGRWEKNVLHTRHGNATFHLDTEKPGVSRTKHDGPPEYHWPLGKSRLVVEWDGKKPTLVWRRGEQRLVIADEFGSAFTMPGGPVIPSPDGKTIVVVGKTGLVLVGEEGVVDQISTSTGGGDGNQ